MKPAFRVGDRVTFKWVFDPVEGIVVEDSGEVGHAKRRFYRVEVTLPPVEPTIYMVAEDEMTAANGTHGRDKSTRATAAGKSHE